MEVIRVLGNRVTNDMGVSAGVGDVINLHTVRGKVFEPQLITGVDTQGIIVNGSLFVPVGAIIDFERR